MPAMLDDPDAATIYRVSGDPPYPDPNHPSLPPDVLPRQVTLRDRQTVATIVPFASRHQVPDSLLRYLNDQFNKEIEGGDTYPMMDTLPFEKFASYWFQNFGAIMVLGHIDSPDEVVEGKDWSKECLGTFYIKPNYPGRSSHVCNAGFIVTDASRNRGVGRLMGECYLDWAPKLGYTYSVFNLVYETNVASCKIWDALGFKRIGRVKGCGNLKSYPDKLIDAIIYGRDLGEGGGGEELVSEERFDKIKFYLKTRKYPDSSDRAEKSRLRSAASHYKLVDGDKLMLKDREVISDPQRQYDIARQAHIPQHGGINKTTAKIAERYHWSRIKETVSDVIRNCAECKEFGKTPIAAAAVGPAASVAVTTNQRRSSPSSPHSSTLISTAAAAYAASSSSAAIGAAPGPGAVSSLRSRPRSDGSSAINAVTANRRHVFNEGSPHLPSFAVPASIPTAPSQSSPYDLPSVAPSDTTLTAPVHSSRASLATPVQPSTLVGASHHHRHHHHDPTATLSTTRRNPMLQDQPQGISPPLTLSDDVSVYQPIDPQIISQPSTQHHTHHGHNHHHHHHDPFGSFHDGHHSSGEAEADSFADLLNAGAGLGDGDEMDAQDQGHNGHRHHHNDHSHHRHGQENAHEDDEADQAAMDREMEMLIEPQDDDDDGYGGEEMSGRGPGPGPGPGEDDPGAAMDVDVVVTTDESGQYSKGSGREIEHENDGLRAGRIDLSRLLSPAMVDDGGGGSSSPGGRDDLDGKPRVVLYDEFQAPG